ncbi:bifunctional glycosyltransferase family 2/GtrA family protein [Weissella minor]|uniref:bifunctional glycosyltransferase family 2/GtrA family protein n=1 Tax=Weissella minor TaxID=1620 RepID=UPI001BAED9A9|nr:bifunctional glycosyltransferase family 2/GtrA family protein [Weissella minor]MBS0950117.1 bifunctional glycosyltransferase family 2/GtrA family protein [Weissella minor]
MGEFGVLIPALNPDEKLLHLLEEIFSEQQIAQHVVLVDDGSDSAHHEIFQQIQEHFGQKVTVLRNLSNLGKGAALKRGLAYFEKWVPMVEGVITLDADGQHAVSDVVRLMAQFEPQALVIGCRTFSEDIPFRSRFGNVLTNRLTRLFTGLNISDTQTGLRIIPMAYVPTLLTFSEDHFEFEFKMLLEAKAADLKIIEVPIETIYIDDNASSHFRVIHDSFAIYAQFLKFAMTGIVSFLLDVGLFAFFLFLLGRDNLQNVMWATVGARLTSGIVNYGLNRQLVFGHEGQQTLMKYAILMLIQMLASGALTYLIAHTISQSGNVGLVKIAKQIGDFILFLISFQIQKHIVFKAVAA